ncbi:hypothetical protein [Chryseobacterium daeguense]|uniref:hypothetical protein n=1 Tax=Chryseobacterium daeguense TaxID=412438 RepID=UPI0004028379|nr:hypothetical protein [Chryseobacterium daeguense]
MQGIEPKLHTSLTERMEYYRFLLKEIAEDPESVSCDAITRASELSALYEDYLSNKRKLEKSIKTYKQTHDDLRKLLTFKIRELKRKAKHR